MKSSTKRTPTVCCLCDGSVIGFGHNPRPLGTLPARCCDDCNYTKVMPTRFQQLMAAEEEAASSSEVEPEMAKEVEPPTRQKGDIKRRALAKTKAFCRAVAVAEVEEKAREREEEERERGAVEAHVAANPYPTRDQLTATMQEYLRSGNPEFRGNVFKWMAEYGEASHACCAVIYTNLFDDAKVKEMGQRIHDRGGFDALSAAFYVLKNFGTTGVIRGQITEHMFNGIGEWRS